MLSKAVRSCPVQASLDVLGPKWTLPILRDLLIQGHDRFTQFEAAHEGITPRVLSRRLQEMEAGGLLIKTGSGRSTRYHATEKGQATLPVVEALAAFGAQHEASKVFWDGVPRSQDAVLEALGHAD